MKDGAGPAGFDRKRADAYDGRIRAVIPGYEGLHASARELLGTALPKSARVLVVGAGTAMEILTCAPKNPGWRFTAVDPSRHMLERGLAKVRKAGLADRVSAHGGGLDQLPPGRPFHAATSLLVSHFIGDGGERRRFFSRIARRLRPGGAFVFADAHGNRRAADFKRLLAAWGGLYRSAGVPAREVRSQLRRLRRDVAIVPEERLMRWVMDAGFERPAPFYRGLFFGGWMTRRRS